MKYWRLSRQARTQEMTGAYELMVQPFAVPVLPPKLSTHYNIYGANPNGTTAFQEYLCRSQPSHTIMDNLTLEGLAKSIYMDHFASPTSSGGAGYTIAVYPGPDHANCQFLLLNTEDKITDISSPAASPTSHSLTVFHKFCDLSFRIPKRQSTGRLLVERPKTFLRH